jgi:signal transduction histidine kinase
VEGVAHRRAVTRVAQGSTSTRSCASSCSSASHLQTIRAQRVAMTDVQSDRVGDLLDGAIAAAVRAYVESRDHEAKVAQARHVAFVTQELRTPLTTAALASGELRKLVARTPLAELSMAVLERNLDRMRALIARVAAVISGSLCQRPRR